MSILFDKALKNTSIVAKAIVNNLWKLFIAFKNNFYYL